MIMKMYCGFPYQSASLEVKVEQMCVISKTGQDGVKEELRSSLIVGDYPQDRPWLVSTRDTLYW